MHWLYHVVCILLYRAVKCVPIVMAVKVVALVLVIVAVQEWWWQYWQWLYDACDVDAGGVELVVLVVVEQSCWHLCCFRAVVLAMVLAFV